MSEKLKQECAKVQAAFGDAAGATAQAFEQFVQVIERDANQRRMRTLEQWEAERMKDWRFRFWCWLYEPAYQVARLRIWLRGHYRIARLRRRWEELWRADHAD